MMRRHVFAVVALTLFMRRDGLWLPVATDGPGDTVGAIPLR